MEILADRTEVSQTWANTDGSQTVEIGVEPVRVRKGSTWVPVDTSLKATANGIVPRASALPLSFSAGGNGPLATLSDGAKELAVSFPGTLPKPVLAGDTATYRDVYPGVDLKVVAQSVGFTEELVVRTRQATRNPKLASLTFGLATKGVEVEADATGALSARDSKGKAVFTSPAPFMWDSSIDGEAAKSSPEAPQVKVGADAVRKKDAPERKAVKERARRAPMKVSLGKSDLTVVPDQGLLTDPDAKLPIHIDPAWTGSVSGSSWTSVWSKYKSSSFWKNSSALTDGKNFGSAGVGRTEDCSGCSDHIIRSLFRMDISKVKGKHILDAKFRIEQRQAWTCSPKSNAKLWLTGAISDKTTWNNQPTWYSSYTATTAANRKVGAVHGCSGPGSVEFPVTSMVAHSNASTTMTVGLRAIDEGTKNQWKRFNHSSPKLAITFNTKPGTPGDRMSDGRACATGASRPYVLTSTPILAAKQTDPDTSQQNLTTSFYWWAAGGSANETNKVSQASGNPSPVSRPIPSGKLADNTVYYWKSRTYDGTDYSDWSGNCEFIADLNPPAAPALVTSTSYPADAPTVPGAGGVGLGGKFIIGAPSSRPSDIVAYAYTLDSGVQASAAPTVAAKSDFSGEIPNLIPKKDGVNTLQVWSKEKSGRFSATPTVYKFKVRSGKGPAASWDFDEASGNALDGTNHGNTQTLAGSATRVAGRSGVGQALSLNGTTAYASQTGAVHFPHPDTEATTNVATNSTFTVAAWVKLAATGGTVQRSVISANGAQASAYTLGYSPTDNKWRFAMAGSDVANATQFQALSNAAPTAGKWTHIAGTFDVSTKKLTLFVNGVAQTTTATLTGGFNATTDVTIGRRKLNGAADGYFTGQLDDVAVYPFAVPTADLALLTAPLPPTVTLPGSTAPAIGTASTVRMSAGGDTNVTSYKYSSPSAILDKTATPATAGATADGSITPTAAGTTTVYARSVGANGALSQIGTAEIQVTGGGMLSGIVLDDVDFLPMAGATVTLTPGGRTTTTAADGSYTFTNVPNGQVTVTATVGGRCGKRFTITFTLNGDTWQDLVVTDPTDDLGYTCDEATATFVSATNAVALTGDDAITSVNLPFTFPFYGHTYRSAWVDTNGVISFTDPGGSRPGDGKSLPGTAMPDGLVAPFWDDLLVDSASSVNSTSTTSSFVIEWRNVLRKGTTSERLSFEAVLTPDGKVTFNYSGLDNDNERGAKAVVGIEAPNGADGLTYAASEAVLVPGRTVTFVTPAEMDIPSTFSLSGKVLSMTGAAVSGAKVTLDPLGLTATSATDGTYRFDGLTADTYTVYSAQNQNCPQVAQAIVALTANTVRDLQRALDYGGMGYACAQVTGTFTAANNVVAALTGDDATTSVAFPFSFPFHGQTYTSATVSTNGFLTFGSALGTDTWANPTMPTLAAPNAVVAPFWDDLEIDSSASVRTDTIGTAPNRKFVVEWRNAKFRPSGPDRITFEAVFSETTGLIAFNYGTLSSALQQGAAATIGIENLSGTVASLFSFQEAALDSASTITFTPNTPGTISGTATVAVTGGPAAGLTVSLIPSGRTTVTDASGNYSFGDVPVGEYTVQVATGTSQCAGRYARSVVDTPGGLTDVDLSVMTDGDEFGYKCTSGATTFIPGTVTEDWTGDETTWQKNPPFPIKLYGAAYTSAWINSNGVIAFKDPLYFGWIGPANNELPTPGAEGLPDAAVYPFWDDLGVDAAASIATATTGTAPNRKWVVEFRNVYLYADKNVRLTFEAIFSEDGTISFAYGSIPSTNAIARGNSATVGIENGSGTLGFQYLFKEALLGGGQGVTFVPSQPGVGAIKGTVTCQGSPVSGATVSAGGITGTTPADGTYRLNNVPAGDYAVIATQTGTCGGSSVGRATVGTNSEQVTDFGLAATSAFSGYTVTEEPVGWTPADTAVLPLTGDEAITKVTLPFPVTHYGKTYTSMWVDTNGLVAYTDPETSSSDAWPIPSPRNPAEPNNAVYPFWHDWVVDASASVRTATRGTAPNRQFVTEWRNVASYEDPNTRVSFQLIIDEASGYRFAYDDIDGTFLELGGGATIGIENEDGTAALQYAYRAPVLRPGLGLRLTAPTA
ncbi:carboxypeptidase regulatory-like domain-containing protein [Micromonospora sp. NPDC048843]|uniref:carboxypeptidase regulatory-like domain-containing protein n=1 Tax=Micromonospora sp. NPDC048843 TaxID=3155389 RepID=UPI0033D38743